MCCLTSLTPLLHVLHQLPLLLYRTCCLNFSPILCCMCCLDHRGILIHQRSLPLLHTRSHRICDVSSSSLQLVTSSSTAFERPRRRLLQSYCILQKHLVSMSTLG
uniref:Uncharacterized protein n=1 Tax=Hemiselmis andersenii TaxID=464988 RepID=A0A7S0TYJ9_HEMAN|mmetsp:Transcript_28583/g.66639  ORF Transcript_28583/g.66639 Transcript_28583/m.66639 type:complete len:105 (+) Transcript_28583:1061-1375(+)